MSKPQKQFIEDVNGIGKFVFRLPRTMRDELKIAAEYSRLTEGVAHPTPWLSSVADHIATLTVLTVEAPEDWNIEEMDPLDPPTWKKITEVFGALRAAEERFRKERRGDCKVAGSADGGDVRTVVSPEVQSPSQPSAVP
jgi:hypothetical protein